MKMRILWISVALAAAVALSVCPAWAVTYSITDLGALSGGYSSPTEINSSGHVTGASRVSGDSYSHVFLYDGSRMQDLGRLSNNSIGYGLNDSDTIVGYGNYYWQALTWDSAHGMRVLDVPGSLPYEYALDINNAGHVLAQADHWYGVPSNAYILRGSSWTQIPALSGYPNLMPARINNLDQVIGSGRQGTWLPATPEHAFLWGESSGIRDLGTLGGANSGAMDINDAGDVVGYADAVSGERRAFLYRGGVMQSLGMLGTSSLAYAINRPGQIVGYFYNPDSVQRAFIYSNGQMQDLNDMISPTSGWLLNCARDINDDGLITGSGINADGQNHAFILTPVPEPSSLLALTGGLGALVAFRRRRA